MILRNYFKLLIPPFFFTIFKYFRRSLNKDEQSDSIGLVLTGPYLSWVEALQDSTGYESAHILEKTKNSLLKVKTGEAVYERDSVLFDEIQYSWSLLAGIMWVAAQYEGRLNVMDYGGSLGSTYYQNQIFFTSLPSIRWNIIEQPDHVKVGKEFFADDTLHFFCTIEECLSETNPNVILLSSVLQYLDEPYKTLDNLMDSGCNFIIIDKTPFYDDSIDQIFVQHVPPNIYDASYPSWIFSKKLFSQIIEKNNFKIVTEFKNDDKLPAPIKFEYGGMIITRNREHD